MDSGIHERILQPGDHSGYIPLSSRPKDIKWIETQKYQPACNIKGKYWHRRLVPNEKYRDTGALLQKYSVAELSEKIIVCFSLPNESKLNEYIDHDPNKALYMETIRLFSYFDRPRDLLEYINKFPPAERSFYEIILGECDQKIHFDLDISDVQNPLQLGQTVLQHVIRGCLQMFAQMQLTLNLQRDVYIYSSHSDNKCSYHIVINNWVVNDAKECKFFYQCVIQYIPEQYHRYVDHMVYSNRQQFRLLACQKHNSHRPKIFCPTWQYHEQTIITTYPEKPDNDRHLALILLQQSLVSFTHGCTYLALIMPERSTINYNTNEILSEDTIQECMRLVYEAFPEVFSYLDIKNSLILLRRHKPSHCPLCNRTHDNENAFLVIKNMTLYWHCRRAPSKLLYDLGKITEDDQTPHITTELLDLHQRIELEPPTDSEQRMELEPRMELQTDTLDVRKQSKQTSAAALAKRKTRATSRKLIKDEADRALYDSVAIYPLPLNEPSTKAWVNISPIPHMLNINKRYEAPKVTEQGASNIIVRSNRIIKPCSMQKPANC